MYPFWIFKIFDVLGGVLWEHMSNYTYVHDTMASQRLPMCQRNRIPIILHSLPLTLSTSMVHMWYQKYMHKQKRLYNHC
nr:MAG TPA: hypothetical protein [Caudoviricetes sp.]